MGRSALLHIVIQTTILVSIATQLYSAAAAADATCSCSSSSALQCHGVTPALQQQLVEQLGSCTATSLQLQQQLLRQQHHTPVVLAVLDSSSMWQLLVFALLLGLCVLCFAQVGLTLCEKLVAAKLATDVSTAASSCGCWCFGSFAQRGCNYRCMQVMPAAAAWAAISSGGWQQKQTLWK